ncbi:hypothetical protein HK105_201899 [Polyrhizophydium stewartii]|uniref:EF-hand domain-containing protein n=1 Tax=Polyrhizophydium stewartii TaxID=2732419 RepID=A0ABR4NG50_9FUNG
MAEVEELYTAFCQFCQFGSSRNLSSMTDITGPTMDGAKWAKFCRDSGIIAGTTTSTDADIWFNKVKAKSARRIDFDQFQEALRLAAAKRFGGSKTPQEGYMLLVREIVGGGGARPIAQGTLPSSDSVTQRMTDHTLYTGTHKNRFDSAGRGRGMAGRDQLPKTNELAKITNREESNVRGVPMSAASAAAMAAGDSRRASSTSTMAASSTNLAAAASGSGVPRGKRSHQAVTTASTEMLDKQASQPKRTLPPVNASRGAALSSSRRNLSGSMSGSVFDRLTDTKAYTGTHKERFNDDGSGRGLAGRDAVAKGSGTVGVYRGGDVKSLSQILRS